MIRKMMTLCAAACCAAAWAADAAETRVVVRAKAHDAKFIGSSVGGLDVTVRDAVTGRVLAAGRIEGDTGDTARIMKTPAVRGKELSTPGTARFVARLNISEPTKIKIALSGPLAGGSASRVESKTLWVLPGRHIEGDGVVFHLYGLIVQPLSPPPNYKLKLGSATPIRAWVTMMCGCPVWPDGVWDANRFRVEAIVKDAKGKTLARVPLSYAGKKSLFGGEFRPTAPGDYKVVITAADSASHNFGVAYTGFCVMPAKK